MNKTTRKKTGRQAPAKRGQKQVKRVSAKSKQPTRKVVQLKLLDWQSIIRSAQLNQVMRSCQAIVKVGAHKKSLPHLVIESLLADPRFLSLIYNKGQRRDQVVADVLRKLKILKLVDVNTKDGWTVEESARLWIDVADLPKVAAK